MLKLTEPILWSAQCTVDQTINSKLSTYTLHDNYDQVNYGFNSSLSSPGSGQNRKNRVLARFSSLTELTMYHLLIHCVYHYPVSQTGYLLG